tara:strand:+ start:7019 stop:8188 length:1170 start_codon:yes stop_codon:yes gene_type:complete
MAGGWIDDTLCARVEERNMRGRWPLVAAFPRQRVEVVRGIDPAIEVSRLFDLRGWTDGLPIVAPTTGRVEEMLDYTPLGRELVIGELEPLKGLATVEKLAINAVMAGCRPDYFPILIAAVEAISEPEFNLRGVQTTDENVTPLILVNGPIARQVGMNEGFGCLGPGWRPNATIGRALRLVMQNIGGGWPSVVAFAGLGQPGRYTLCFCENEAQSPWQPFHVDASFAVNQNIVTVLRAESLINVTGGLEEVASIMGSAASAFSWLHGGFVTVVISPATAKALEREGISKQEARQWLHANGRIASDELKGLWIYKNVGRAKEWPDWSLSAIEAGYVPPVEEPDKIALVVAGGDIPIAQQAYFPTWGYPDCCIMKEVILPNNWRPIEEELSR